MTAATTSAPCPECGAAVNAEPRVLAACARCGLFFRMPAEPVVVLSTGKAVLLQRWGWQQPDEQFQRFGPLSEAEATEAWAAVIDRRAQEWR